MRVRERKMLGNAALDKNTRKQMILTSLLSADEVSEQSEPATGTVGYGYSGGAMEYTY